MEINVNSGQLPSPPTSASSSPAPPCPTPTAVTSSSTARTSPTKKKSKRFTPNSFQLIKSTFISSTGVSADHKLPLPFSSDPALEFTSLRDNLSMNLIPPHENAPKKMIIQYLSEEHGLILVRLPSLDPPLPFLLLYHLPLPHCTPRSYLGT